jgi:hypothetical protein
VGAGIFFPPLWLVVGTRDKTSNKRYGRKKTQAKNNKKETKK